MRAIRRRVNRGLAAAVAALALALPASPPATAQAASAPWPRQNRHWPRDSAVRQSQSWPRPTQARPRGRQGTYWAAWGHYGPESGQGAMGNGHRTGCGKSPPARRLTLCGVAWQDAQRPVIADKTGSHLFSSLPAFWAAGTGLSSCRWARPAWCRAKTGLGIGGASPRGTKPSIREGWVLNRPSEISSATRTMVAVPGLGTGEVARWAVKALANGGASCLGAGHGSARFALHWYLPDRPAQRLVPWVSAQSGRDCPLVKRQCGRTAGHIGAIAGAGCAGKSVIAPVWHGVV